MGLFQKIMLEIEQKHFLKAWSLLDELYTSSPEAIRLIVEPSFVLIQKLLISEPNRINLSNSFATSIARTKKIEDIIKYMTQPLFYYLVGMLNQSGYFNPPEEEKIEE